MIELHEGIKQGARVCYRKLRESHGLTLSETWQFIEELRRLYNNDETVDALRLEQERRNFPVTRIKAASTEQQEKRPRKATVFEETGTVIDF